MERNILRRDVFKVGVMENNRVLEHQSKNRFQRCGAAWSSLPPLFREQLQPRVPGDAKQFYYFPSDKKH
jgi:hypothetical protein